MVGAESIPPAKPVCYSSPPMPPSLARPVSSATLALACIAASGTALASPLEDPSEGGAVFTGPTEPHASSIFINPAAMALARPGKHFLLGSSLRLDTIQIDRTLVAPDGQTTDGADVTAHTLSPGAILGTYWSVLDDRAVFGAILHTPVAERFVANEQELEYHSLGGFAYQSLFSVAGSFRVAEWFLFGLGLSLGYSNFQLSFARDTALEAGSGTERGINSDCGGSPCGIENAAAAEYYQIETSSGGFGGLFEARNLGATLGLAVRIGPKWWTALSYVSPPGSLPSRNLDLELDGSALVEGAERDGGELSRGRAEVTLRMPQSIWLGAKGPLFPGYNLVASARWQNLSRHQEIDIRMFGGDLAQAGVPEWYPRYRGLRDVWQLSAGIEGEQTGRLRVGGRLRLESGATPDRYLSPLQVSGLNLTGSGGVELPLSQQLVLQASYGLTWFPDAESSDSVFDPLARLDCVDSDYNFFECRALRDGRAIPTAAGNYRRFSHALALSLRIDLP